MSHTTRWKADRASLTWNWSEFIRNETQNFVQESLKSVESSSISHFDGDSNVAPPTQLDRALSLLIKLSRKLINNENAQKYESKWLSHILFSVLSFRFCAAVNFTLPVALASRWLPLCSSCSETWLNVHLLCRSAGAFLSRAHSNSTFLRLISFRSTSAKLDTFSSDQRCNLIDNWLLDYSELPLTRLEWTKCGGKRFGIRMIDLMRVASRL